MSKYINKSNYKTVSFGSEGYTNLDSFTELTADVSKNGELRLIDNGGSWKVGASKKLYTVLGEPHCIKVLMNDTQVAVQAVPDDTPGAYEFCKGAIIYSNDLAEKIMALAKNTEFKHNCTSRCGRIEQVQTEENGSVTVILSLS